MPNHPRSPRAPAVDVEPGPRPTAKSEHLRRFEAIVRADPDLMRLLQEIRTLRLPQWRLVAGCLYQTVWNVPPRDRHQGLRFDLF